MALDAIAQARKRSHNLVWHSMQWVSIEPLRDEAFAKRGPKASASALVRSHFILMMYTGFLLF
uniref:Uncharacterized protein n=1 Tax=Moorena producens (strain JHB) TaxID=1454205 RepID=A0A1D9FX53_MOOP1